MLDFSLVGQDNVVQLELAAHEDLGQFALEGDALGMGGLPLPTLATDLPFRDVQLVARVTADAEDTANQGGTRLKIK